MINPHRTFALTMLVLKPVLRHPVSTILVSVMPLSFIVIFGLIGGKELSLHALYGTLVAFATNVGVISLPQLVRTWEIRRLKDIFVASPLGPFEYAFGMGLSRLLWVAPGLILVTGVIIFMGGFGLHSAPAVMGVILVIFITGILIGFTVATMIKELQLIGPIANMMGLLMTTLAPVYYPLSYVPEGWQWLPMIVPTTHAAELVRHAGGMVEVTAGRLWLHWGVILVWGVIAVVLVTRKAEWRQT